MRPQVLITQLRPDAVVPRYMTELAAGMDLCAAIDGPIALAPGERRMIGTGLAMAIPPGFEGQVRPRSGAANKHGLTCVNSPGTVDADYRGELCVLLINLGQVSVTIQPRDRIAQIIIAPVVQAELVVVDELPPTERGAGGFGSTGR